MTYMDGVQVKHNGTDISQYIVSYEREHKICSGIGMLNIVIDDSIGITFIPWDSFEIYEGGIHQASYYTTSTTHSQPNHSTTIVAQDNSKRLQDYFIDTSEEITTPITITSKISEICHLAGVNASFSHTAGDVFSNNATIGLMSAYDQIVILVQMIGFYFYFDEYGNAHFGKKNTSSIPHETYTINNIINFSLIENDKMSRNRILVWGSTDPYTLGWIFADIRHKGGWEYDRRDLRTVVISNSLIKDQATAVDLGTKAIHEFSPATVEKHITAVNTTSLHVGDAVLVKHELFQGVGNITTFGTSMSKTGFVQNVVLDERCPRLFAYFNYGGSVYAGTYGAGVWGKLLEYDDTWYDFSTGLTDLNVTDLHINAGLMACVTSGGKAFSTFESDASWIPISLDTVVVSGVTISGLMARACIINRETGVIKIAADNRPEANTAVYSGVIVNSGTLECVVDNSMSSGVLSSNSKAFILDVSYGGNILNTWPVSISGNNKFAVYDIENDGMNDIISVQTLSGMNIFSNSSDFSVPATQLTTIDNRFITTLPSYSGITSNYIDLFSGGFSKFYYDDIKLLYEQDGRAIFSYYTTPVYSGIYNVDVITPIPSGIYPYTDTKYSHNEYVPEGFDRHGCINIDKSIIDEDTFYYYYTRIGAFGAYAAHELWRDEFNIKNGTVIPKLISIVVLYGAVSMLYLRFREIFINRKCYLLSISLGNPYQFNFLFFELDLDTGIAKCVQRVSDTTDVYVGCELFQTGNTADYIILCGDYNTGVSYKYTRSGKRSISPAFAINDVYGTFLSPMGNWNINTPMITYGDTQSSPVSGVSYETFYDYGTEISEVSSLIASHDGNTYKIPEDYRNKTAYTTQGDSLARIIRLSDGSFTTASGTILSSGSSLPNFSSIVDYSLIDYLGVVDSISNDYYFLASGTSGIGIISVDQNAGITRDITFASTNGFPIGSGYRYSLYGNFLIAQSGLREYVRYLGPYEIDIHGYIEQTLPKYEVLIRAENDPNYYILQSGYQEFRLDDSFNSPVVTAGYQVSTFHALYPYNGEVVDVSVPSGILASGIFNEPINDFRYSTIGSGTESSRQLIFSYASGIGSLPLETLDSFIPFSISGVVTSGSIDRIETSNFKFPNQYIFASFSGVNTGSGNYGFYQQNPDGFWRDCSATLPNSRITIIRVDEKI